VDQVLIVAPLKQPDWDPRQVDRYLTHVGLAGLQPVLILTKCDLLSKAERQGVIEGIRQSYQPLLGEQIYTISKHWPESLTPLYAILSQQTSVLAGVSGAGKSSLLNAFDPALGLRVAEISAKLERGQHTTRHVALCEVNLSAFESRVAQTALIADTPGFSQLSFAAVEPQALREQFSEWAELAEQCSYHDCLHWDEPNCQVREAFEPSLNAEGSENSRYLSYRELLEECLNAKSQRSHTSKKQEYGVKAKSIKGQAQAVSVIKLKEKQREASRKTQRQRLFWDDLSEED
jgi:ribosome biogenesis GTPase / thiamine phosphate phosphatase